MKSDSDVKLRLPSNMVSNSNDETNFPQNLLLTDRQSVSLRKSFANNSSATIQPSKPKIP